MDRYRLFVLGKVNSRPQRASHVPVLQLQHVDYVRFIDLNELAVALLY